MNRKLLEMFFWYERENHKRETEYSTENLITDANLTKQSF